MIETLLSLTLICLKVSKDRHSIDNSIFPPYHYFLRDGEMKETLVAIFYFFWQFESFRLPITIWHETFQTYFSTYQPCFTAHYSCIIALVKKDTILSSKGIQPHMLTKLWQTESSNTRDPAGCYRKDYCLFNLLLPTSSSYFFWLEIQKQNQTQHAVYILLKNTL